MRPTYHLVLEEAWAAADPTAPFAAESLATEGFVHCTDRAEELAKTFDRYYASDDRPFCAVTVDLDALDVPWRYDVPGSPYPHVYGTIARRAILDVRPVARHPDGRFRGLGPARS